MNNLSKIWIKIHPKEGLMLSVNSSPWLKICVGVAIILAALGFASPFMFGLARVLEVMKQ